MKKKVMLTVAVASTLLASALLAMALAGSGQVPIFTVRISNRVVTDQSLDPWNCLDTWLYVQNPSTSMDMAFPQEGVRVPADVVKCNYVDLVFLYPDGEVFTLQDHADNQESPFYYRWTPIVDPGERTMVVYFGWIFFEAGTYRFTYTLNVDFQGRNYNLVKSFTIQVWESAIPPP